MVGNAHDANVAITDFLCKDEGNVFSKDGSTRTVYLINGVIYKVAHPGFENANVEEYDNITNTRALLPAGVYYPEASLFDVHGYPVIAMERIFGQLVCDCFCMDDMGEECNEFCMDDATRDAVNGYLGDTGGFNVMLTEEGICIIDAA